MTTAVATLTETTKRYFLFNDDGTYYCVIARDPSHAEQIMRTAGIEFGYPSMSYDAARESGALSITEMTLNEALNKQSCHTEDDRGVIRLVDANVGEWFCSEY